MNENPGVCYVLSRIHFQKGITIKVNNSNLLFRK